MAFLLDFKGIFRLLAAFSPHRNKTARRQGQMGALKSTL
jgi:hypothetical protein